MQPNNDATGVVYSRLYSIAYLRLPVSPSPISTSSNISTQSHRRGLE